MRTSGCAVECLRQPSEVAKVVVLECIGSRVVSGRLYAKSHANSTAMTATVSNSICFSLVGA